MAFFQFFAYQYIEQLADSSKVVKPKPNVNKWDGEDIEDDVKVKKFLFLCVDYAWDVIFRYEIDDIDNSMWWKSHFVHNIWSGLVFCVHEYFLVVS